MTYDFSNPQFKNGVVTFSERKPDLLHIFRQTALRKKYVLKTDMILYSPEKVRIAKVQNYFDMLMVTMLSTRKYKKLYTKKDIEQFFREINENTEFNRGVGMNLTEAKQYLKKQGYIVERKGDFYDPSTRPEFYDPEYNAKEVVYADVDSDDCDTKGAADVETTKEFIKKNYPDANVKVEFDFDINDGEIKYTLDKIYTFKNKPTSEEVDKCDEIDQALADIYNKEWECPWDDGDGKVYAVDANGKKIADITGSYWNGRGKQDTLEDSNVDHYEVHELWYGVESIPEYEDEGPDFDWYADE